jgi:hypothetical protein
LFTSSIDRDSCHVCDVQNVHGWYCSNQRATRTMRPVSPEPGLRLLGVALEPVGERGVLGALSHP